MFDYLKNEKIYGIDATWEDIVPELVQGNIHNMTEQELKQTINYLKSFYEEQGLYSPCFKNDEFLTNLINSVDINDITKYMVNTNNYQRGEAYDPQYVLCFRRAIPSEDPKPENFWSTDFMEVIMGLHPEIEGIERLHSVINVATLAALKEHGTVVTSHGVSDGEIAIDPNKDFTSFLFRYKPFSEFSKLIKYVSNGGVSRDELLKQLKESSLERMKAQGLIAEEEPPIKL